MTYSEEQESPKKGLAIVPNKQTTISTSLSKPRSTRLRRDQQEKVLALDARGVSIAGIARAISSTPKTVRRFLDRNRVVSDSRLEPEQIRQELARSINLYRELQKLGFASINHKLEKGQSIAQTMDSIRLARNDEEKALGLFERPRSESMDRESFINLVVGVFGESDEQSQSRILEGLDNRIEGKTL